MENLSNINYNRTEVYSNSEESKPDRSPNKLDPDTEDLTKGDELTINPISIGSTHMINDRDFNSLCSPYIASKLIRVVI